MANAPQTLSSNLATLRNFRSDNGHTYYAASPGYRTKKVLVANTAVTITIPTDGNGVAYRAVDFSSGGNPIYVNPDTTATGPVAGDVTSGTADMESPAFLSLTNGDNQTLGTNAPGAYYATFSLLSPVACTVYMRWFN